MHKNKRIYVVHASFVATQPPDPDRMFFSFHPESHINVDFVSKRGKRQRKQPASKAKERPMASFASTSLRPFPRPHIKIRPVLEKGDRTPRLLGREETIYRKRPETVRRKHTKL